MSALPKGWVVARVEDFARPEPGSMTDGPYGSNLKTSHYTADGPLVVRLGNIKPGLLDMSDDAHVSSEHFAGLERHHVEPGDIVIAALGDPIGRAARVPWGIGPAMVKADCFRLRPSDQVEAHYLIKWLNSEEARASFLELSHGMGRIRVNLSDVRNAEIPLPPLPEQRRIVAKLDRLSARTKAARTHLARVQSLATRAKQATLAAAFRGELTADWRNRHRINPMDTADLLIRDVRENRKSNRKLARRKPVKEQPDIKLPESWCWVSPDELADDQNYSIGIGPFGSNLVKGDYREAGIPLVFVRNIRTGNFGPEGAKYIAAEKGQDLHQHWVHRGDLLITKMGDPPGDAAIFDGVPSVITADCVKMSVDKRLSHETYILHAVHSDVMKTQIAEITTGVAHQKMSLDRFRQIAVPVAPKAEQTEIVRRIEAAFARIDRMVEEATRAAGLLDRLDERLLARAFRGELVPQDPTDEPASTLLARIQAARAAAPMPKRGRRQRA